MTDAATWIARQPAQGEYRLRLYCFPYAGGGKKLIGRSVRLLWLQPQGDFSQDFFATMFGRDAKSLLEAGSVRIETIAFTDHTMTDYFSQVQALRLVQDWLSRAHESLFGHPYQETGH